MEPKYCRYKPCTNYGNEVKNLKCQFCFSNPLADED